MRPVAALLAAALLAFAIIVGGLAGDSGGEDRRPESSSLDSGPAGMAGWAGLLRSSGIEVDQLERPPARAGLDPEDAVVLLDAGQIAADDVEELRAFVAAGGRLVAAGRTSSAALGRIGAVSIRLGGESAAPVEVLAPGPEVTGVGEVDAGEGDRYEETGSALPLLGDPDAFADLLAAGPAGRGRIVLLADAGPVRNERLASADNALLALNLVGGRDRVVFVERLSAGAAAGGLGALPESWLWGAGGLLLAALVLVASQLRRLGPPAADPTPLAPPRSHYVEAMAGLLARSGRPAEAAEPVRRAALNVLARRTGPLEGEHPDRLAERAAQVGGDPEEGRALAGELRDPAEAIGAARLLARVWR